MSSSSSSSTTSTTSSTSSTTSTQAGSHATSHERGKARQQQRTADGSQQHTRDGRQHVHQAIVPDEADYYAVLGVAETASEQEIKQQFRRLAKLWHPDHFTSAAPELQARAERRMQRLNRAYALLSDPIERVAYDQRRLHPQWAAQGMATSVFTYQAQSSQATFSTRPTAYHTTWRYQSQNFATPAHHANNPNGAGMLGATLCVILALGILRLITVNGLIFGPGFLLSIAAIIGFVILMGYLLNERSVLAQAARRFFEYEPSVDRRERQMRPHPQHYATHTHTVHAEVETEPEPTAFELLVDQALADIPAAFHRYLENVVVRVKPDPTPDELERMKVLPCSLLLGLYEGVPLTQQGAHSYMPEVITIFQHSIERYCHEDPARIRHQVRATVFHELAHHFGMKHEDMPAWVK